MAILDLALQTDKLAKKVYSKEGSKLLENMSTKIYSKLKNGTAPEGEGYVFNVGVGQNQSGIKAMNEHESLAVPDYDDSRQGKIVAKKITGTCEFTGMAKYALAGQEASFGNAAMKLMKNTFKETLIRLDQMIFRNGTGLMARVNGAVAGSATVHFDTGIKTHFRRRMSLDMFDAGTNLIKQVNGIKVQGISSTANTLIMESAVTCDDNAYVYLKDEHDNAPTAGKSWAGLPLATDDGTDCATYENITRSGSGFVDIFKGLEIDALGANLSDDLLQRALELQENEGSDEEINMFITRRSQARKYLSLTLPQVEYKEGANRDTGVKGQMSWQGIPMLISRHCGRDEIYLLNDNCFKKYILSSLKWADEFGGQIIKWKPGYDKGIAYCRGLGNFGSENPRGIIRTHSLATPTV